MNAAERKAVKERGSQVRVLILGSGPAARDVADWDISYFDVFVVINNAWRIRPDWTHMIHPEDLPEENRPPVLRSRQTIVTAADYVPVQNNLGGFLYAGGTMAFTAGYWALGALEPSEIGFFACDMVYPKIGDTHFYGVGEPDPLRQDITLQSLEAKSTRLMLLAAERGCACVNYSGESESRLVFPKGSPGEDMGVTQFDLSGARAALRAEAALGYMAEDGRYWLQEEQYDKSALARIDALWLDALRQNTTALSA